MNSADGALRWRFVAIGAGAAYVAILVGMFVNSVGPRFGYVEFAPFPPSALTMTLAWILALLPLSWMPLTLRRPSSLSHWLMYVLLYVPAVVLPPYASALDAGRTATMQVVLAGSFALFSVPYLLPLLRLPRFQLSRRGFWIGVVLAYGLLTAVVITAYGLPTRLPSLGDVYLVRDIYKAQAGAGGRWASVAPRWLLYVLNPAVLIYGILYRRYIWIAVGVAGALWIYSVSGMRSSLLMPVLVAVLLVPLSRGGRWTGPLVLAGVIAVMGVSAGVDAVTRSGVGSALVARRAVMIPGLMTGLYFDFFDENPKIHMSNNTRFAFLTAGDYPYHIAPPNLIGSRYFGSEESNANVNLWGDGYANFGLAGVVIMSAILAAFLDRKSVV